MIAKILGWGILLFITIFLLIEILFLYSTANRLRFNYPECKLWAHRGLHKEASPNSFEGIKKAYDRGIKGVEIDVYFLNGHFFLTHDFPEKTEGLDRLDHILSTFKNMNFWLDFKNLKTMSKEEAKIAAKKLKKLLEKTNMMDKVIIESRSASRLAILKNMGLHTSYWITLTKYKNPVASAILLIPRKIKYVFYGPFSAVSMDIKYFNWLIGHLLHSVDVMLFTVNNESILDNIYKMKNVKVILTDRDFFNKFCKLDSQKSKDILLWKQAPVAQVDRAQGSGP